jgi:putative SOS response-associated peptidase YedK
MASAKKPFLAAGVKIFPLLGLHLQPQASSLPLMCHHYKGARNPPEHLADEFSLRSNLYQLLLPDEGFYPLATVPVIRLTTGGERELVGAEWGFLPAWWKPSDKTPKRTAFQRKCINARSEDVELKPTYRDSFRRRRCLMPAEEFFERGYYFHLADHRPFAFAALWDQWRAGEEQVDTCTLLTTDPNEAVAGVGHNRMPVVFRTPEEYARWLDPEITERPPLEDLLRPTEAEIWQLYPASAAASRGSAQPSDEERHKQGFLF